jgi:hypothetical protein
LYDVHSLHRLAEALLRLRQHGQVGAAN